MLAIVQSRFSSQRLPGKALMKIGNTPMLLRVVNVLKSISLISQIVVATSTDKSDDQIADICVTNNIEFYRGSLDNVSLRFRDLLKRHSSREFIRVSGDSPLIQQDLIINAINIFQNSRAPVVTNIQPRSYPKGQSVEILSSDHFIHCYESFKTQFEFEHVTPGVYRITDKNDVLNFSLKQDFSTIQLSVDTKFDLQFLNHVFERKNIDTLDLHALIKLRQDFEQN